MRCVCVRECMRLGKAIFKLSYAVCEDRDLLVKGLCICQHKPARGINNVEHGIECGAPVTLARREGSWIGTIVNSRLPTCKTALTIGTNCSASFFDTIAAWTS